FVRFTPLDVCAVLVQYSQQNRETDHFGRDVSTDLDSVQFLLRFEVARGLRDESSGNLRSMSSAGAGLTSGGETGEGSFQVFMHRFIVFHRFFIVSIKYTMGKQSSFPARPPSTL